MATTGRRPSASRATTSSLTRCERCGRPWVGHLRAAMCCSGWRPDLVKDLPPPPYVVFGRENLRGNWIVWVPDETEVVNERPDGT